MFKMSLKTRNKELTHWISMSFARLSSLSKSSLFITLAPELVLQPFVFQLSTQLVIPVQRESHHKSDTKEASKDQERANSLLTRHHLCTKSQAKTLETKDILVWFSAALFQDCIFSLLPEMPNHVFSNRCLISFKDYSLTQALYTNSHELQ